MKINEDLKIFYENIKFIPTKASGPGGQHINKVSSAVILKYDLSSFDYPVWFKEKIHNIISENQIKGGNIITIKASSFKSQKRNKKDAIFRLIKIFEKASKKEKRRIKTLPPKLSKLKRLERKKNNSMKKSLRRTPKFDD